MPRDVTLSEATIEQIAGELCKRARRTCNQCMGTGRWPPNGTSGRCPACGGRGYVPATAEEWHMAQALRDLMAVA